MSRTQYRRRSNAAVRKARKEIELPDRIIELYYWSREPDLLAAIRAIAAMPQASREHLAAFFDFAGDPQSVTANVDGRGNLTLASPNIAEALAAVSASYEKGIELAPDIARRIH